MQTQSLQKIVICGAGFLGSYIAKALAGNPVKSAPRRVIQLTSRDPSRLQDALRREVSPINLLPHICSDVRYPETLLPAFEEADVVVSLVGIMYGSPKMFEDIQWKGAENVAKAAKRAGAKVIHLSAIGANRESKIPYERTKALGEEAIRAVCQDATIIRPSLIFGPGDGFFARFATLSKYLPILPVFGGGTTKYQPVYAGDIGKVVEIASRVDDKEAAKATNGKIIEAGGPDVLTYKEMMETVLRYAHRSRPIVSLPYAVGMMQGFVLEKLPPNLFTLTRAQVEQLKKDNVVNSSPPDHVSFDEILQTFTGESVKSVHEILPTYLTKV